MSGSDLARFKAGDRRALEAVYREHVAGIAGFLGRGFGFRSRGRRLRFRGYRQPFDLDNAVQETFRRAFEQSARRSYDGLHSFKNYLFAIARNLVVDELRSREVAMSPFVHREEGARVTPASAEQDFLRRELGQLYALFFDELNPRDRSFFRARFEQQETQVDAGRSCGLSHMQARTLEKNLRLRFLRFMRDHGYLDAYSGARVAS